VGPEKPCAWVLAARYGDLGGCRRPEIGWQTHGSRLGEGGGIPESDTQGAVVHDQDARASTRSRGSGCPTFVVPVETTGFDDLDDLSNFGRLDWSRLRAVHVQRPVATPTVVMRQVVGENSP
jgi:hypothetical protein